MSAGHSTGGRGRPRGVQPMTLDRGWHFHEMRERYGISVETIAATEGLSVGAVYKVMVRYRAHASLGAERTGDQAAAAGASL